MTWPQFGYLEIPWHSPEKFPDIEIVGDGVVAAQVMCPCLVPLICVQISRLVHIIQGSSLTFGSTSPSSKATVPIVCHWK